MKNILQIIVLINLLVGQTKTETKIITNHIGYELNAPKKAVILASKYDRIKSFNLKVYPRNYTVLTGKPVYSGPVDKWRNWVFWTVDLTDFDKEGQYILECEVNGKIVKSFPFVIQKDLLERHTLSNVIYYFKSQRCSGLMDKADRQMTFDKGSLETVDVHGGWYDATGDYSKNLSHLSFSTYFNPQQSPLVVYTLFKTYEAITKKNDQNFNQIERRLLDEAMYGADYLVRVKNPSGSFYRVIGAPGLGKKPEDRRIFPSMKGFRIKKKPIQETDVIINMNESNTEDALLYQVGYRAGGGMSIAALAIAARYNVSGDFSNEDYLNAAKDGFAYLEKQNIIFTNDGKENIVDDYCALIAATELYKTTKDHLYKKAADFRAKNLLNRISSDQMYKNYFRSDDGNRPFFHASDAGLPILSLLYYVDLADTKTKNEILHSVRKYLEFELSITNEVNNPFGYCRQYVQNKHGNRRSSFFFPHDSETSPWWQGENARLSSIAAAARLAALHLDDPEFSVKLNEHAWNQLNWILGLNPFDASMLQGTGRNNPTYLFFNTYQYQNAPGGICNGITAGLYDQNDIDLNRGYNETGMDHDWRWGEQWLPHAAWYILAISASR
tara:strand:- start:314 stop:2149 length:1836 start_codon:yes stop_codon:yes gene_type:complete